MPTQSSNILYGLLVISFLCGIPSSVFAEEHRLTTKDLIQEFMSLEKAQAGSQTEQHVHHMATLFRHIDKNPTPNKKGGAPKGTPQDDPTSD